MYRSYVIHFIEGHIKYIPPISRKSAANLQQQNNRFNRSKSALVSLSENPDDLTKSLKNNARATPGKWSIGFPKFHVEKLVM